jgi:hypothetical protein
MSPQGRQLLLDRVNNLGWTAVIEPIVLAGSREMIVLLQTAGGR